MKKLSVNNASANLWCAVLVLVQARDRARWKASAALHGMSIDEWIRDRMNRIAPESP